VPLLNEFGQRFFANGFRLGGKVKKQPTVPLWAIFAAQGVTSNSIGAKVPINYNPSRIGSYGYLDKPNILYHLQYQPTTGSWPSYLIHPFNKRFAVQIGEIPVTSQLDPNLELASVPSQSLSPAGAGSLGGGRYGPLAIAANVVGARFTASLSGEGALPYSDGLKLAATIPYSTESPYCAAPPRWKNAPTGAFVELYQRRGMNSLGVSAFSGRDGRHSYGIQAQAQFQDFYLSAGATDGLFLGAQTHAYSFGGAWVPAFQTAVLFRVDDQDGFYSYVPGLSLELGGEKGLARLLLESTITKGVAPTTTITLSAKF
jgi:hypothetical protein